MKANFFDFPRLFKPNSSKLSRVLAPLSQEIQHEADQEKPLEEIPKNDDNFDEIESQFIELEKKLVSFNQVQIEQEKTLISLESDYLEFLTQLQTLFKEES